MNPLLQLQPLGQSVWLDNITRRFIAEGGLAKLIQQDGLRGVTSNPTIFQKAITGSTDYDAVIAEGLKKSQKGPAIFETLAVADIQQACDAFKDVYAQTQGLDGYVSLEVNPHLARNTQGTLQEARDLWKRVNRPNLMIKIPAAVESLPAVTQALAEGINVNVTLIFALDRYQQVIDAWLAGLEKAAASGKSLGSIASVASFFISRVDSLVDGLLEKQSNKTLQGKAAIANACLAYQIFEKATASARYQALKAKGAAVQRPLWASTSTKNPAYRDVLYVEELIGPNTVNTLPPATIDAFRDHGVPKKSLPGNTAQSQAVLADLEKLGIRMADVTRQLEDEGLKLFTDSYDALIQSIEAKRKTLVGV